MFNIPSFFGFTSGAKINFDPDAIAFFARVDAATATTDFLTTTEKDAVNDLVIDMKNDGIWTKMKAIYPMVGASAAACAQNLKSSSFTGVFNGGWTFASTGVTANASNTFMNTNLLPNVEMSFNNQSYTFYRGNTNAGGAEFGVNINSNDGIGYFPTINYTYINTFITSTIGSGGTEPGNYTMNRNGDNRKTFKNSVLINSNNVAPTNFVLPKIYLGARNEKDTSIRDVSNSNYRFFSIGQSLTDSEVNLFYTAIQAFQITLGREV